MIYLSRLFGVVTCQLLYSHINSFPLQPEEVGIVMTIL